MARLKRILRLLLPILGVLAVLLSLAAVIPMRTVDSTEMLWSLQPGDRVWIIPDRVRKADMVLLEDPLEPGRMVLRRVVAIAGEKVRVEDNSVRINGKRIRQVEMGTKDGYRIEKEVIWSKPPARANPYFVRVLMEPTDYELGGIVEVPEGHYFVLADDRDNALDSRWWGTIPEESIRGVVRAHYTAVPDEWRFSKTFQLVRPEDE